MLQAEAAPGRAPATTRFIRRHPVVSLVVLVFVLEWLVLFPLLAAELGLLPFSIPTWIGIFAGWAPGLAAAIVVGALHGWAGVKKLFSRYLIWRVHPGWYVFALFGTLFFIAGGIGLNLLLGGAMPDLPVFHVDPLTLVAVFGVTVVMGFLFNLEDVAWRGVAQPKLQETRSALATALIIGVLEALTHLPYYFVPGDFRRQTGVWFIVFSVAIVILMTWMYNNTGGSLLLVVLYHATQNTWANLLDTTPPPGPNDLRPFLCAVALMWVAVVAVVAIYGPQRLSRKPREELPRVP